MEYRCGKCKISIVGGFKPTGFSFDHAGIRTKLCKPCYVNYWEQFKEVEKSFVKEFFKEE